MGIKTMADAGNENERAASHLSRSRREKVSLGKPQMRGKRGQRKLVAPSFFFFFSFSFFAYRDLHVRSQVIGGRVEADRNLFALASDDGLVGNGVFEIEIRARRRLDRVNLRQTGDLSRGTSLENRVSYHELLALCEKARAKFSRELLKRLEIAARFFRVS